MNSGFSANRLFYLLLFSGLALAGLFAFAGLGALNSFVFLDNPGRSDSFMDFFNPVFNAANDPYKFGDIYPPLALFVFRLFGFLLPQKMLILADGQSLLAAGRMLRDSQMALGVFAFAAAAAAALFAMLFFQVKKGPAAERTVLVLLLLASAPFFFMFERGNIIVLALILSAFFVFFYDSPDCKIREAALVALALAAGIKLYPAVFGLLLLRDRMYREAARCALYGAVAVIAPFWLWNGTESVSLYLANLPRGLRISGLLGNGYKTDFANIFAISAQMSGWSGIAAAGNAARWVLSAGCATGIFLTRSKWKAVAMAALLSIGFPQISCIYSLTFMAIALVLFLDREERSATDYLYAFLFAMLLAPHIYSPVPVFLYKASITAFPVSLHTGIVSFFTVAFAAALIIDAIYERIALLRPKPLQDCGGGGEAPARE